MPQRAQPLPQAEFGAQSLEQQDSELAPFSPLSPLSTFFTLPILFPPWFRVQGPGQGAGLGEQTIKFNRGVKIQFFSLGFTV